MTTRTCTRLLATLAALAAIAAAFAASPAAAQTPCWKTLINDWFDGRIDGTYPIPCYRDAIRHLPTDVKSYSSAREDINQALQQRLLQNSSGDDDGNTNTTKTTGGKTSTTGEETPTNGGDDDGGDTNSGGPGPGPGGNDKDPGGNGDPQATPPGREGPGGFIPTAESADSVPVPLIVLGALAALLMAAGAAGFVARRVRTRRMDVAAATAVAERTRETPPPGT